jgi:uncharacterized DUF497 family protein
MEFRWNDWNEDHVARHGVSLEEAEHVVEVARSPFPRMIEDDKRLVWGRGRGGRPLQVIFFLDEDDFVYIIHARPLTEKEKARFRRITSR